MVKVIFVKNPFSPARDRVIKLSEAADRPLNFYTEEFTKQLPNQEAWIQIDGTRLMLLLRISASYLLKVIA